MLLGWESTTKYVAELEWKIPGHPSLAPRPSHVFQGTQERSERSG